MSNLFRKGGYSRLLYGCTFEKVAPTRRRKIFRR